MSKGTHVVGICLISIITISLVSFLSCKKESLSEKITNLNLGEYISGGRNVNSANYINAPGFPPFPDKAKWPKTA
jgi:hypothetical protein